MTAQFSVLLLTATPPGCTGDANSASVKVADREALLRSTELFVNREGICQIQVAFAEDQVDAARQRYGANFSFTGVRIISGGSSWTDQFAAGLKTLSEQATHILIHDAARIAVPQIDLESLMSQADQHDAIALTAPISEQLIEITPPDNTTRALAKNTRFVRLLTPQCYSRSLYAQLAQERRLADVSSMHLLAASPLNVRLNRASDAALVKAMLGLLPRPKVKGPANPFEEAQW